ncbi:DsbA family protein [Sulfurospirillum sp.]|uniref:DsbA family protein n=1 Tax=Sulfurospirillum sp. TaxID=2053622 RepID=UPI002FDD3BE3
MAKLYYLLDPLCGWCYGASGAVSKLVETYGIDVSLMPTGLFSTGKVRKMDADFAAYAWENDQKIAHMTGQSFTEAYRKNVLGDRQQFFDSSAATMALTAVMLTNQEKEFEVLKAIQHARYVDGKDITSLTTLTHILKTLELEDASMMLEANDKTLIEANHTRITKAQAFMQEFGANGVPTFIAQREEKRWQIPTNALYANLEAVVHQLKD